MLVAASSAQAQQTFNKRMTPSNTVRAKALTERSDFFGPSFFKEFVTLYGGTVRIRWQVRTSDGSQAVSTGVFVGPNPVHDCDTSTQSTGYVNEKCDVSVPAGVPIRIWVQVDSTNGPVKGFIRNAQLFFDLIDETKPATVLQD